MAYVGPVLLALDDGAGDVVPVSTDDPVPVNGGIYQATPAEASKNTLVTSTLLAAANDARTGIEIQNQDATNPIYIALDGNAAVANGSCYKLTAGLTRTIKTGPIPKGDIYAISTGGTVITHVAEYS